MPAGWDQSTFNDTLKRYLSVSKKTLADVLNTKGYFIARGATRQTRKTDKTKIEIELGRVVTVNRLVTSRKTGITKIAKRRQLVLSRNSRGGAPLAALIVNARAERAGGNSPFFGKSRAAGIAAMNRAVQKLISARNRSVAFLKSGWLPAIKKLAPFASKSGAPAMDASARQIGRAKGDAKAATPGFVVETQIINLAFGNRTTNAGRDRAMSVATRGLQRAFDDEASSMNDYLEKKLKPDADDFNSHQH